MPYVVRNDEGRIVALHLRPSAVAQEELRYDNTEVAEFIEDNNSHLQLQSDLLSSDIEFVRVLEDLITALIDKGAIRLTDLPPAAQEKISMRQSLRNKLTDLGEIVGDTDDVLLP
ncbi:MAG: hypothetical protein AAF530_05680 [Pseudomonadota bacterium]